MDTVRIVRDLGNARDLFPAGVDSLADMPYTLFEALREGSYYAKFQEMPADEAPPRNIWRNTDLLTEHFEEVERKRKAKYSGKDLDEEIEDPVDNDAASLLITDG